MSIPLILILSQHEKFQRSSAEPIDHFSPTLDAEKLKGACACTPDETVYVSAMIITT